MNNDRSGGIHTNMLVDTETSASRGAKTSNQSSPHESGNDPVINIKTEPVDRHSDIQRIEQQNNVEQASHPLLSYHLPFPQYSTARTPDLREAFVPVGASWPILHNAPVNANAFLPHAFGFIPAGLGHARTPLEALASLDPNTLAQRKQAVGLAAAGLSQWVNISLDVARAFEQLRQTPMTGIPTNSPIRKRKVSAEKETQLSTTNLSPTQNGSSSAEFSKKRIRLHESLSDGVKRSASDDPGRQINTDRDEESTGKKKTLERRNSAPSTNHVSQILKVSKSFTLCAVDLRLFSY